MLDTFIQFAEIPIINTSLTEYFAAGGKQSSETWKVLHLSAHA
jgi:hypothetical protein